METFQERLTRLIAEQLKEADPKDVNKIQQLAAIQNAAEDVIKESKDKLDEANNKLVEISTAYKDVVTSKSFAPTQADKAKTEVSPDGGMNALFQELFGN